MILDVVQAAAAVATAVGVLIAGWQLRLAKQQAATAFEDQLTSQYRDIVRRLPIQALLGEALDDHEQSAALRSFYHYIDLSNEQAFPHRRRRMRGQTWSEWREGIEEDLRRPAFAHAWAEVRHRAPDSFNDLRDGLGE